ncbi:hypothetical protein DY000_02040575 [Brassica cretica]|uniref:Jacalin-type lectin domain-containing protein n=1 Tax=Brassica cretica TaxID=69181 RepID=A0ABQ7BI53_BRACR|nr:hypothetical protein DY000_02040575 [Brassica cretica]
MVQTGGNGNIWWRREQSGSGVKLKWKTIGLSAEGTDSGRRRAVLAMPELWCQWRSGNLQREDADWSLFKHKKLSTKLKEVGKFRSARVIEFTIDDGSYAFGISVRYDCSSQATKTFIGKLGKFKSARRVIEFTVDGSYASQREIFGISSRRRGAVGVNAFVVDYTGYRNERRR